MSEDDLDFDDVVQFMKAHDELQQQLSALGREFNNPHSPVEKRRLAREALALIYFYLESQGIPLSGLAVIGALLGEIENMDEGNEVQFLVRPKVRSGKRKPVQVELVHAFGAAAIDHLVSSGLSELEGAQTVADEMNRLRLPLPKQKRGSTRSDAHRLLDYRARLRGELSSNARTLFDAAVAEAKVYSPPLEGARAILRHAAAQLLGQEVQST